MSTTARHACEVTLRGNITIDEIERRQRAERYEREIGAEAAALELLRQFGPMPRWHLSRLVMDRGHKAFHADRAVKILIISRRIAYHSGTKLCGLIEARPVGLLRRVCRAITGRRR